MASRHYRSWGTAGYSNYSPGYTSTSSYITSYAPPDYTYRNPEYGLRYYNPYKHYTSYYNSNRSLEDDSKRPAFYGYTPYGQKFDFVKGRYTSDNRFTNLRDAEEPLYYQDITDLYLNTSKLQSDYRDIVDRYSHLRRQRLQSPGLPEGYGPPKYSAPDRLSAAERYGLYERRPRYGNRMYDTEITQYEPYTPHPSRYERARRHDHEGSVGNVLYSKELHRGHYNIYEDGPRTREEWEMLERDPRNRLAERYPYERDGVLYELEMDFDKDGYDRDGYDRDGYHRTDQLREGPPRDLQDHNRSDQYLKDGYTPREHGFERYIGDGHGTTPRDNDTASTGTVPRNHGTPGVVPRDHSTPGDAPRNHGTPAGATSPTEGGLPTAEDKKPGDDAYLETGDNTRPHEDAEEDTFPEEEEEPAPAPVVKSGRSLLVKQGSFMNVKKEADMMVEEAIPMAADQSDSFVESFVESGGAPLVKSAVVPVVESGVAPSVESGVSPAAKAGPVAAIKAQAGGLKKSSSRCDVEKMTKLNEAQSAKSITQEGADSDDDLENELVGKVDSGIDSNEEGSFPLMAEEELLDDINEEIDIRIDEPEPEIRVHNEISAEEFAQVQEKVKLEDEKEKPLCALPLIATVTSHVVKVDKIVGEFKTPDPNDPDSPVPLSPLPGMTSCYVVSPSNQSVQPIGATTNVSGVASMRTSDPLSSEESPKEVVLELEAERTETPLGVTAEVVRLEEKTIITETEEEILTEVPAESPSVPAEVHLTLDPVMPEEYNEVVTKPIPQDTAASAAQASVESVGKVTMKTAPVADKKDEQVVTSAAIKVDSAAAKIIDKSNGLKKEGAEEQKKAEKTEKKSKLPSPSAGIPKPSGKSSPASPANKSSPVSSKTPDKKGKFGSKLGDQKSKLPAGAPKKKRLW